jgi:hypothetical protein
MLPVSLMCWSDSCGGVCVPRGSPGEVPHLEAMFGDSVVALSHCSRWFEDRVQNFLGVCR